MFHSFSISLFAMENGLHIQLKYYSLHRLEVTQIPSRPRVNSVLQFYIVSVDLMGRSFYGEAVLLELGDLSKNICWYFELKWVKTEWVQVWANLI